MEKQVATQIFVSLSSGIRLDIYRLLVRLGPDGMVAGQIAAELGLPANNLSFHLSFHLKDITYAGLLSVVQEGRFQRYRANIPLMLELIAYLTEECCSANPEQCADMRVASSCSSRVLPPLPSSTKDKL